MQGAIDIKISKGQTTEGQRPDIQQTEREPGKPTVQNQAVNAALINAGKQVLNQSVSQFADLTGNYAQAETIENVLSIGSDLLILSTGPVGLVAVGTKYIVNATNSFIKQKRALDNIALARERLGFISTQGSRYGR